MKKEWNILPKKKVECYLQNEWLKFVLHVGLVDERPDPETSCPNNLEKDIVKSMKLCSRKYLLLAPCSLVGVMYIDDDLIRIWAENYKVLKNIFFQNWYLWTRKTKPCSMTGSLVLYFGHVFWALWWPFINCKTKVWERIGQQKQN